MSKPFFSVIVTEHNSATFMRKGLDSVISQTFTDYELIIVCDSCTDNTAEIAREYIRPGTDDRVLEVAFHNSAGSWNTGLDEAKGEWLLWMDDDDWYLHEVVFEMLHDALQHVEDIDILAYGFYWKGLDDGKRFKMNTKDHLWPAIWNKCWRREFIGDERFPFWTAAVDYGFAVKMHPKARFAFLYEPLYFYNFMRKGSESERMRNEWHDPDLSDMPESVQEATRKYIEAMRTGDLSKVHD